jgi:KRAB domain-containing zinc finger protein
VVQDLPEDVILLAIYKLIHAAKSNLSDHKRREKPYVCKECGKAFVCRSILLCHKCIHAGIRSYVCEECGKAFIKRSDLSFHERFHTKTGLSDHKPIHIGEKSYVCE